jgi:hypothetical protein
MYVEGGLQESLNLFRRQMDEVNISAFSREVQEEVVYLQPEMGS